MSYAHNRDLDQTSDLTEARVLAGLSTAACIDLCDITPRTWQRWCNNGAPKWATRLILATRGTLDRYGWKDWEIRGGLLYFNQLAYRYWWDPVRLVLPCYGITDPEILYRNIADNVSGLEKARELKLVNSASESQPFAETDPKSNCV